LLLTNIFYCKITKKVANKNYFFDLFSYFFVLMKYSFDLMKKIKQIKMLVKIIVNTIISLVLVFLMETYK
jgi:hypothetical protein